MTVNELIVELERLVNDGHGELDIAVKNVAGCFCDISKIKMTKRYKAKDKAWIYTD